MLYNKKIVQTPSYLEIWEYGTPIKIGFTKKKTSSKTNKKIDDIDKLKRLVKSRKNAKHELMRLIDTNFDERLTKFITITTKENIQDRKIFNQEFDKFMKRLN
ncbi:TPA: Rep protein, partial [Streptococcus agalactiae]